MFESNPSLDLDLSNNNRTQIDVDFSEFDRDCFIDLSLNDCINAKYGKRDDGFSWENLMEFHHLLIANCRNEL